MASGDILPSGIWATALWLIGVYSFLCLFHDRTPLWPKRRLQSQLWRRASLHATILFLAQFTIAGFLFGHTPPFVDSLRISLVTNYIALQERGGIFQFLAGTHYLTRRRAKRVDDNNGDKDAEKGSPTEGWSEDEPDSMSNSTLGQVETPTFTVQHCGEVWELPLFVILLPVWTTWLQWLSKLIWEETPSLKAFGETWLSAHPIIIIMASVATSIRYIVELRYARDEEKMESGCDKFKRALLFFLFFHLIFSAFAAQVVIAYATGSAYCGIPAFDESYGVAAYAVFTGFVACFVAPLFTF